MSPRVRHDWLLSRLPSNRRPLSKQSNAFPYHRRLRIEPLEDRRLLANVTVGNVLDVVNGNTSSIANLIANNGGDGISLREAVLAANATAGADSVLFASSLSGATITLGGTEIAITEALTIDARPLAQNVTINAGFFSRIFNITATTGDFTLGGLTLTGGRSSSGGGAIRSATAGKLGVERSDLSVNVSGFGGGAISAIGNVELNQCTVNFNRTSDFGGGGIRTSGNSTLTETTVNGNHIQSGYDPAGGGISAGGM
jgi:hypothetical protein